MTREDEEYLFESIEKIKKEVHLNNLMLCDIIGVINTYLANYSRENEEDFGRNVLANLISGLVDLNGLRRKKL